MARWVFAIVLTISPCTLAVPPDGGKDKPKPPADVKPKPSAEVKSEPIGEKHYRIYDAKGNVASLAEVLQRLGTTDVIFLGESHDDPVAHHLQLLLLRQAQEMRQKGASTTPPRPLTLSMEMFERDVQPIVDEYLSGLINEANFLSSSRPWNNYRSDYRPLIEFAREQKLAVLAANAPRRYVNRVGRLGAAALKDIPDPLGRGLPPLPYGEASPAYAARFRDVMKGHGPAPTKDATKKPDPNPANPSKTEAPKTPPTAPPSKSETPKTPPTESKEPVKPVEKKDPHASEAGLNRALEAQSLWDASMAYTIAEHLLRAPRAQVVHLCGSFHSAKRMGTPEHLLRYRPGTSVLVITMQPHKEFPNFHVTDMTDLGDFVIVTDASLPRTSQSAAEKK